MPLLLCMRVPLSEHLLPAQLDIRFNGLGDEGEAAIKEAVRGKEAFKLLIADDDDSDGE